VAFTFTERAAAAMKERIYRRATEYLGLETGQRLGSMFVGTIHSYCARLLQDHFGYGNWDVLDEDQEIAFLLQHGWELDVRFNPDESPLAFPLRSNYANRCLLFKRSEAVVAHEMLNLELLKRHGSTTAAFADTVERYWTILDRHHLLTFDRLVRLAVEHLSQNPGRAHCRHLIVDEYQDLNRAQEQLVSLLCAGDRFESCLVVGDPRQCIYEWRGSDPACFDRFAAQGREEHELAVNRRSRPLIIETANTLARNFRSGSDLQTPMQSSRPEGGGLVVWTASDVESEADWVADQVMRLVDSGKVRFEQIAMLLRSIATSGGPFTRAFRERNIPYLVAGKLGLFRHPEARALGALWIWAADREEISWSLPARDAGDFIRVRGVELLDLAQKEWPGPGRVKLQDLEAFREQLHRGEFPTLLDAHYSLLALLGYRHWDPERPEDAVRLANLGRFSKLVLDYEAARRRGGRRARWPKLVEGLAWYIVTYASEGYAEEIPEDLTADGAVVLSTVHQAKGLEWPVVFVPALTEGRFPSRRAGMEQAWLLDRGLFEADRYEGSDETERRLFYVAITRARDLLVLSRPEIIKRNTAQPSRFWDECGAASLGREAATVPIIEPDIAVPDDEVKTRSIQEVLSYLRCPMHFRFRHVWGYEAPLADELGFGRSLHHVLRVLAECAATGQDPLDILESVLDEHFIPPFAAPQRVEAIRRTIAARLRVFLAERGDLLHGTEEVEARLEFAVCQHTTVTGRVDVIRRAGQGVEVIDYKSDASDDPDQVSVQVQLYAAGLRASGYDVCRARVVYPLDGGSLETEVPVTPEDCRRALERAEAAVKGMAGREFQARPGAACATCDFVQLCPHGPCRVTQSNLDLQQKLTRR